MTNTNSRQIIVGEIYKFNPNDFYKKSSHYIQCEWRFVGSENDLTPNGSIKSKKILFRVVIELNQLIVLLKYETNKIVLWDIVNKRLLVTWRWHVLNDRFVDLFERV